MAFVYKTFVCIYIYIFFYFLVSLSRLSFLALGTQNNRVRGFRYTPAFSPSRRDRNFSTYILYIRI